jgi:predicted O-methyltransferase YrrM
MEFDDVAARIAGIPFMSPELGHRVYDHVRRERPRDVLELGTAHGVSAAYIAAALEANGDPEASLTTVDHGGAAFIDPTPAETLARAGVAQRVSIVREHSSYNWWLARQAHARADAAGNVAPAYDFVYLDGAKNLNVDGLAVVLIEKLLRPGGWLLMDDLEWTYRDNPWIVPSGDGHPLGPLSEAELTEAPLSLVFDLLVVGNPAFTRLIREDAWYGWAQKAPDAPRRLALATSRPLGALVADALRRRFGARRG